MYSKPGVEVCKFVFNGTVRQLVTLGEITFRHFLVKSIHVTNMHYSVTNLVDVIKLLYFPSFHYKCYWISHHPL